MNKTLIALSCSLILIGAGTALNAGKAPKKITIKKCGKKKTAVTFDHEIHSKKLKIKCKACHHKGKVDKPCASCHKGKAKDKVPGCAEMSIKKNAYHIQCVGCHKKEKKGPRRCKQCHKK